MRQQRGGSGVTQFEIFSPTTFVCIFHSHWLPLDCLLSPHSGIHYDSSPFCFLIVYKAGHYFQSARDIAVEEGSGGMVTLSNCNLGVAQGSMRLQVLEKHIKLRILCYCSCRAVWCRVDVLLQVLVHIHRSR